MVDQREAFLTATRQAELLLDPVRGRFDVDHLREVHRRIFQDLSHHGPGEFRPDAPGHFKTRMLEASRDRVVVPYALRPETDRLLGPTLDALQGGTALRGFDLLEMSEGIAQTYARLDYLHPFREGNSRTLRTFTEQLARENGYRLDWGTTNVTPQSRDALYIARDVAVIQQRYPGLTADSLMTVEDRERYEMAFQLHSFRRHDPLQELVRRSLERGRDAEAYDRRMDVTEMVREIAAVGPVALQQAEQHAEDSRLAVLRHKGLPGDAEQAAARLAWVVRDGSMEALTARLERIEGGESMMRHDPGAPALDRLVALAEGIDRGLARQQGRAAIPRMIERDDIER